MGHEVLDSTAAGQLPKSAVISELSGPLLYLHGAGARLPNGWWQPWTSNLNFWEYRPSAFVSGITRMCLPTKVMLPKGTNKKCFSTTAASHVIAKTCNTCTWSQWDLTVYGDKAFHSWMTSLLSALFLLAMAFWMELYGPNYFLCSFFSGM